MVVRRRISEGGGREGEEVRKGVGRAWRIRVRVEDGEGRRVGKGGPRKVRDL